MWQKRQAELLRSEIEAILAPLESAADLYELVKEPLTKSGRGLAIYDMRGQPWALLPLIVCEAISGHYEKALPAAAALQLLVSAGDVFDDIEDADSSDSLSAKFGSTVAINAATVLIILAEKTIAQLKSRGVEDYIIVQVMDLVNSSYTTACIGQHLDLSLSSDMIISEDMYIGIAKMKSASQVECACYVGALLASANQELIDSFTIFGQNIGMAAQITNDILGIINGSDILKPKISLPVIYALTQTEGEARNQLEITFGKNSKSALNTIQIQDLLFSTGAIHYAMLKMEIYKQQALDNLYEVERMGASVEKLRLFLG